jgi:hypothetical protein
VQRFSQISPLLLACLLTCPTLFAQQPKPPPVAATQPFFRECTPHWHAAHACSTLDRVYAGWLRNFEEAPLSISPESHISFLYRFAAIVPDTRIAPHLATVAIMDDGSVRLSAKTAGLDGTVRTSRSFWLTTAQAKVLLANLRWRDFLATDSYGAWDPDQHGEKGVLFLLEGFHDGKYHAANLSNADFAILMHLNFALLQMGAWDQIFAQ